MKSSILFSFILTTVSASAVHATYIQNAEYACQYTSKNSTPLQQIDISKANTIISSSTTSEGETVYFVDGNTANQYQASADQLALHVNHKINSVRDEYILLKTPQNQQINDIVTGGRCLTGSPGVCDPMAPHAFQTFVSCVIIGKRNISLAYYHSFNERIANPQTLKAIADKECGGPSEAAGTISTKRAGPFSGSVHIQAFYCL